jgi:hypothetical protein
MRTISCLCLGLWLCALIPGISRADTYQLTDGQILAGEIVSFNESGLVVRQADNKYSDRTPWTKFSQDDLKKLAQNPKIAQYIEPFIELTPVVKNKKPDVEIRTPPRLERPQARSLLGALFSSSVGLFMLFAAYAANLYAALEIARFRARPVALVCGVSALVPMLGPVIFLAIPERAKRKEEDEAPSQPAAAPITGVPGTPAPVPAPGATYAAPAGSAAPPPGGHDNLHLAQTEAASATAPIPAAQVFQRGAFTFNRRFFETKFPGFFGVVRRDADKNSVLVIKSARGEYAGQRITRITSNDLHLQVQKGNASEEIMIPFTEIKEIKLTHNPE